MKKIIVLMTLCVAVWAVTAFADQTTKASAPAEQLPSADALALQSLGKAFLTAYNAGNAKAVAELFVPQGEIVNPAGESAQGRPAIEKAFEAFFKDNPQAKMAVSVQSLRLLTPATAVEDGASTVTSPSGETIEQNRYVIVFTKQDGKWQMASARDLPNEGTSSANEIKQLDWMIGDWVDESPNARAATTYRWADDGRAILCTFQVQSAGQPVMSGTQRIGWDPNAKKLHSWVYDSEGGFAEGVWTRNGDQWTVKTTGVTNDGRPASSTNVIGKVANDRMTWQSRDRVVGDEITPNIEPVVIVRKAPKPQQENSTNP